MSGQLPKSGWGLLNPKSARAVTSGEVSLVPDSTTTSDGATPAAVAGLDGTPSPELRTEAIAPAATADAAPVSRVEGAAAEAVVVESDGSEFLAKLARAMHTTAARERTRIADDAERRRAVHVQSIRERAASEVERIRELAGEDMKAIEGWAEGEASRIKLEREQREKALNEDLELSLTEHGAKIDHEIKGAEAAVATYRTLADAFFEDLDHETDPVVIAREAARYPVFPLLPDEARTASDGAATGPAMVGVMSQGPTGGSLGTDAGVLAASPGSIPAPAPGSGSGPADARVPAAAMVGASGSDGTEGDSPLQALLAARSEGRPQQ